jgi:hypothetical protein
MRDKAGKGHGCDEEIISDDAHWHGIQVVIERKIQSYTYITRGGGKSKTERMA